MFLLLIPVAMTCIIILLIFKRIKLRNWGLPCGPVSKESACNAENPGLILGSGRSCGGRNGNPLQSSCLGDPMDRGAWWATVHGVTTAGHNSATKQRQSWKIRKMEIVGSDCMVKEQIKTHPPVLSFSNNGPVCLWIAVRVYVLHSGLLLSQMVPLLSGLSDTTGVNVVELGSKTVPTSDGFFL